MGKKSEKREENITITEGMIEKIIDGIKQVADMSYKQEEKSIMDKEKRYEDEQKMTKEEFARIIGMMNKFDPKSEDYRKLAEVLYKIKNVLTGWY